MVYIFFVHKGDLMDEKMKKEALEVATARIIRSGGKVNKMRRTITPPKKPGIKLLGSLDCLVTYGNYHIIKEV